MRQALTMIAMATVLIAPARAETPVHQEVLGFTLGQRAPELTNASNLQNLLRQDIARDMTGLMVVEQPKPRYQIKLKDSRRLTLWFDAAKKERPIYWIELVQLYDPPPVPPHAYDHVVQSLGGSYDFHIGGPTGAPLGALLIKIDPTLPPERVTAIKQHISKVVANRPKQQGSQEDPFIEPGATLQSWLDILGNDFRGKLVSIYTISNKIDATITVLIDTAAARAQSGAPE